MSYLCVRHCAKYFIYIVFHHETLGSDSSPHFLDAMSKTTQENRAKFHFSDAKARFFSLSYGFPL